MFKVIETSASMGAPTVIVQARGTHGDFCVRR